MHDKLGLPPSASSWRPRDERSSSATSRLPGLALLDPTTPSPAALLREVTGEASRVPRPLSPAPPAPPLALEVVPVPCAEAVVPGSDHGSSLDPKASHTCLHTLTRTRTHTHPAPEHTLGLPFTCASPPRGLGIGPPEWLTLRECGLTFSVAAPLRGGGIPDDQLVFQFLCIVQIFLSEHACITFIFRESSSTQFLEVSDKQ